MLASATGKEVSDQTIASYLKDPTRTQVLKLDSSVPVELRYETIVVEDGKLYIYKDVYDQNTNTEENLRLTLARSNVQFEDLSEDERAQVLEALNAMSSRPQKSVTATNANVSNANATPAVNGNTNENANRNANANANEKKPKAPRKPISRKQKQVVLEVAALNGKGYPAPMNLDSGSGKPARKAAPTAAAR